MASHVSILEDFEEDTTPHVSNLEGPIQEDSFHIRFTVEALETPNSSPDTEDFDISCFEVPGFPLIMPCEEVLQNIPEFLRTNVSDYLSESNVHSLASEITSYYQQIIQNTTNEAHNPRSIPLNVQFYVDSAPEGQYIPMHYVLQPASLYEEHQDFDDDLEIYQVIDQSMQQLSLVPVSQEAVASLKKIRMQNEEICSICLEEFGDDDVSATPCNHFIIIFVL